ncbi:MAG: hypothetical protein ACFB4I_19870 [Cyanophyceae cyanobacterium]
MASIQISSPTANLIRRRAIHRRWHRYQSQCQILRSQLGFESAASARPQPCQGCLHYHGKAYGQSRAKRTILVCGFHPYGWNGQSCPDWREDEGNLPR